ncbi:hypothetical protein [Microbacterium sp. CIAB417]|uniref:hypothetical protein n=1 Tax=Microbacterium sp. CIAB417 TaxID=2860287 RepID=UPI001FAE166C|nr:hypothetical protein [Microbacterium sp. CIAB417]
MTDEVPIDADTAIRIPGEELPAGRVVRGAGADATGEVVEFHDPIAFYREYEGGGALPETTDSFGHRTAAQGTSDEVVKVDDATVSRIFPAYNQNTSTDERVPAWDLRFDLAAAHAQGRTNLPLPLSWYASPFAHTLDAAAPWLLGASIVTGAVALVIARRNRSDDGLLRT